MLLRNCGPRSPHLRCHQPQFTFFLSVAHETFSKMSLTPAAGKRSCVECHRRKIKCDKLSPCSYCVKVKVQCRYPPTRTTQASSHRPNSVDEDLNARIERIENTLESFQQNFSQIWQLLQPTYPTPAQDGSTWSSQEQRHDSSPLPLDQIVRITRDIHFRDNS